ncbi:MAG: nucleotide exchange factor GrpE [Candidatus Woesearchaeota archaeon]
MTDENNKEPQDKMDKETQEKTQDEPQNQTKDQLQEEAQEQMNEQQPNEDPKDQKIQELTSSLQRLQAEFDNYRKRTHKEYEDIIKTSTKAFVMKLLPIIDNIDLALKNDKDKDEFIRGVQMIFDQFRKLLIDEGIREMDCIGKVFDPSCHEAMLTEESDQDNIVLDEFQKGYTLHGKVIRPAKVKVGKKTDSQGNDS